MRRNSYAKFITRLTDNRGIDRGASMILIICRPSGRAFLPWISAPFWFFNRWFALCIVKNFLQTAWCRKGLYYEKGWNRYGKCKRSSHCKKSNWYARFFRCSVWGTMDTAFNPNGSIFAIEGITSPDGRVLGKMGHSERIGNALYKNVDGKYDMKLFESAVKYFK